MFSKVWEVVSLVKTHIWLVDRQCMEQTWQTRQWQDNTK